MAQKSYNFIKKQNLHNIPVYKREFLCYDLHTKKSVCYAFLNLTAKTTVIRVWVAAVCNFQLIYRYN